MTNRDVQWVSQLEHDFFFGNGFEPSFEDALKAFISSLLVTKENELREEILAIIEEHKDKGFDPATTMDSVVSQLKVAHLMRRKDNG